MYTHIKSLNTKKNPQYMALKIQVLTWYRHKIVAGLNVAVYCFVQNKMYLKTRMYKPYCHLFSD